MILVAGEALLDLVVGDGALLPSPGGGPYNTARALGRLGASVGFLGRLSQDHFGSLLTNVLAESGVSLHYTSRGPEPSALAIAHRSADGEADYSFYLGGTTFGYAAFLSGPAVLGWLVHTFGVQKAMLLPLALSFVLVVITRWMPAIEREPAP